VAAGRPAATTHTVVGTPSGRGRRQDPARHRPARGGQVHLLAAMDHADGMVLAQRQVDSAPGEVTGFRPLLAGLDLTGVVVTADALHTQREHAEFLITRKQADYPFIFKGNSRRCTRSCARSLLLNRLVVIALKQGKLRWLGAPCGAPGAPQP
jgi:hypothetical protein